MAIPRIWFPRTIVAGSNDDVNFSAYTTTGGALRQYDGTVAPGTYATTATYLAALTTAFEEAAFGANEFKATHNGTVSLTLSEDGVLTLVLGGLAPVHPRGRLPPELNGLPNGHYGSHQFLVDDFLKGCALGKLPPNHVWQAARYCAPGIVAHESARRGGAVMEVADLGDPPAGAEVLRETGEIRL